jgi:ABC-type Zn uptake system ZnuABC Zn-binding protein ZnuA
MKSLPHLVLIVFATALPVFAQKKTVVQSTNYPLHYFAERLATDVFDLNYVVDPEIDPAFWKPRNRRSPLFKRPTSSSRTGQTTRSG